MEFFTKFDSLKRIKKIRGLVTNDEGQEILLDEHTLREWSIIPPNFPEPMDEREKARVVSKNTKLVEIKDPKGSRRTSIRFIAVNDDEIEIDKKLKELKKNLLKEFRDVFKTNLEKSDRINMPPMKIETIKGADRIRRTNFMTAIETPLHLQSAANEELQKMLKAGFIEPCHHSTEWCARSFFVTKPNSQPLKVRLVSDFRGVNRILKRPGYPMEGSSLLLKRLNPNETVFCTIDLSSGYHQVQIAEESRDLFSIILPQGKFRFCVLPQGSSPASDLFNIVTDTNIRNEPGHYKNVDDILTAAKDVMELEKRLRRLLQICREKNIKLNVDKFDIGREVNFGGVKISGKKEKGDPTDRVYLNPSDARIDAITQIKRPENRKDVQSLLGHVNQLKSWLPEVSFTTTNLRRLTSSSTPFKWTEDLDKEFLALKDLIQKRVQLSPLDLSKEIHVYTDAAQLVGMAFVLCQPRSDDEKDGYTIVTCDSTNFTKAQMNYSPFECECLAVQWATHKLDFYIRGAEEVKIFSDAKSLKGLFATPIGQVENDRLQQMMEKTLPYNLSFTHIKGSRNGVCDYGSRHPQPGHSGEEFPIRRPSICHRSRRVLNSAIDIKDPHVAQMQIEAKADPEYQEMLQDISTGRQAKHMSANSELRKIEGELKNLSVDDSDEGKLIIRNGSEILVPKSMRKDLLDKLHATHLETTMMKKWARGKFFWPHYGKDIEDRYRSCKECAENQISKVHKTEVVPPDLSLLAPGEEIHIDFCTYGSKNYLVLKDRASGYLYAYQTKNQGTEEATKAITDWCYTYGLPHCVRSDGGPAFRQGFSSFLQGMGIDHKKSSPYNSQSNGLAERGVRSLKDVLKKEKTSNQEKIKQIVFNINTHIQNKNEGSAAERFLRRHPRSSLPNSVKREIEHRELIQARHKKQKRIAEQKGRVSADTFELNDRVILQDPEI